MHIDLSGQVAIISGGGRGIGLTLVQRFADEGAKVVALDVAFPEKLPDGVLALTCDVTDEAAVATVIADVADQLGTIDILINNAGINVLGEVESLSLEQWRRCFEVNVTGVFLLCQAVIPVMKRANRGRILNAASFAAIIPSVGAAAYAASKAAVAQFSRVLASELGPWNITVNSYAPGMVPSAMNGFDLMPAEAQDRLLNTLSLRRWETAEDVANLLVFLASDEAGYITGTLADVSGGKFATQIPSVAYEALL